jgi:hypothetical protein
MMLPDDNATVELVARAIASGYGSTMLDNPTGGKFRTIATDAGYGHGMDVAQRYGDDHWREYWTAARFVIVALNLTEEARKQAA